ncbi:MAG: sigma-70 family RNA polymerase sigma factor [Dehalococcoidales bacterium]|nr:sigma-70 family RNA polymerase sigma factor [Dehalococcoidales bacterium]
MLIILTQAQIAEKIGDSAAEVFSRFYAEYLPRVFRYVSYRITDNHLAEDITSVIFEKALTNFKSYRAEKASFSTWIFTIARNTLTDHYRKIQKRQTVPLEDPVPDIPSGDSPEDELDRAEEIQILNRCIARLSPVEREIISLKFGAEMTNRQIARTMDLSESNVGIIVFRAVRKLRDNFRERENG